MNVSLDTDRATMFALEASSQAAAFGAPEPAEAIARLLNKQPPSYRWPTGDNGE